MKNAELKAKGLTIVSTIKQYSPEQSFILSSPVCYTIKVDDVLYGIGENLKGLYKMINPLKAYFPNEAIIINPNFILNENIDFFDQIRTAVHKAQKS